MLSPDEVLVRNAQIFSLFQSKGWIRGDRPRFDLQKSFESACKLASELNDAQYQMYLTLLGNYTKIEFESYLPGILSALDKVEAGIDEHTVIRAIPLLAPSDEGKNKSGPSLLYFFTHAAWAQSARFGSFRIAGYTTASKMPKRVRRDIKIVTFVVDDFIGSGNTVFRFLDTYEKEYLKPNEKVVFLAVAAMKTGMDSITERGYEIQADTVIPRGIADCGKFDNKAEAYALMDHMESMIQRSEEYRYGYEASEALVTMIRTPNNTFPIFWSARKTDGTKWPAPFPR